MQNTKGLKWVHGTRIGIAESKDGRIWKYKDTANINYRPDVVYTFWAPDVIESDGIYHMYLSMCREYLATGNIHETLFILPARIC